MMPPLATVLVATACGAAAAQGNEAFPRTALRPEAAEAARRPAAAPPHAEPFALTLPRPLAGRGLPGLIAALHDDRTAGPAVAALVRQDLDTLRRHAAALPADRLHGLLTDPATAPELADACGLLFAVADPKRAPHVLSSQILARAKAGGDACGCTLGLMLCGGERGLDWVEALCRRPRCPLGYTLSALVAADAAVREPAVGLSRDRLHAFAAALLTSDAAAEAAVDRLAGWRAWERASDVLNAAANSADPDDARRRALEFAAVRFALDCAADPAGGSHGALCRGWLADLRTADPDLLRRARRVAGR